MQGGIVRTGINIYFSVVTITWGKFLRTGIIYRKIKRNTELVYCYYYYYYYYCYYYYYYHH